MLYEKIYENLEPSRKMNRYQLQKASVTLREDNDETCYPPYFDDLTYHPGGIEFKVKYAGDRLQEESYCIFIPIAECSGFLFGKNPDSDDIKKGMRFDKVE